MAKAKLSLYQKQRILGLVSVCGGNVRSVQHSLRKEGLRVPCRQTIWRFWKRYKIHKSFEAPTGIHRGALSKLTKDVFHVIERAMQADDETTGKELQELLWRAKGKKLSISAILKGRRRLGWSFRRSAYCQLIRDANKIKRLEWGKENLDDDFHDVIWTDETSVQLETHRRFCCRKKGQKPRYKPRPKHPVKLHVWGGISWNGRTRICSFDGIMNAERYTNILSQTLVPSIQQLYPGGTHRFMQDNDPKHTLRTARVFFKSHGINWWRMPPESPDANPIENLWHELKEYLRREIKPRTEDELIRGIQLFWSTVDIEKCRRYIGHLKKVIPRIIEL